MLQVFSCFTTSESQRNTTRFQVSSSQTGFLKTLRILRALKGEKKTELDKHKMSPWTGNVDTHIVGGLRGCLKGRVD